LEEKNGTQGTNEVSLPTGLLDAVAKLMEEKFERRPEKVSISAYISELIRFALEKEKATAAYPQFLEVFNVDKERVFIRDNRRDVVAELTFREKDSDLYCDVDSSKNCVHVGFAWSIPAVQRVLFERSEKT
jgi:hypothetical protein